MEHLWSQAGATGRNPSQTAHRQERLKQADPQPVATHGNGFGAHGKEGVDSVSSLLSDLAHNWLDFQVLISSLGYPNRRSVHWLWGVSQKADSRVQRSYGRSVRLDGVENLPICLT